MATLAEDIATYFVSNNTVLGYGNDCFSDTLPDKPDKVLVMYEYPSDPITQFVQEIHRSIQIVARDANADEAKKLITKAFNALKPTSDNLRVDFTPYRFGQVYLRQAPFKLKEDESNRVIYCFNIGITTTID